MPVTRSPLAIPHIDRHDAGTGGRGPDHKLPTGGGGDDDSWAHKPQGRRGPRERLIRYRIGLSLGMAAILMFFFSLASAYLVRKGAGHIDPISGMWVHDWTPLTLPSFLWINTALLLLASVAIERARRLMFHPTDTVEEWLGLGYLTGRRCAPWLVGTLVFGSGFLYGQYRAWLSLQDQHVFYGSSAHFFYLLTGAHAAHLILGIVALLAAVIATAIHAGLENRQILIDATAWYWHGMSVVWLGIFALIGMSR